MGIFGWSYPPGCHSVPGDEDYPCAVCGGWDIEPAKARPGKPACICQECPECGQVGCPDCYKPAPEGHGLVLSDAQKGQAADVLERQRLADEDMAARYNPEQERKDEEELQAFHEDCAAEARRRRGGEG